MNKEIFRASNYICFTSDLDWAPEAAIEDTLRLFVSNGIVPTVFVTHQSSAVDQYKGKIDLGIHPNFILPSSQGSSMDEIVDFCMDLVPEARVFRCHRWYASNDVYDLLKKRGMRYESNLCTNLDILDPFVHRSGMIGFPVYFEDGAYIMDKQTLDFGKAEDYFRISGLKVINVHPMHYALNTPWFQYTREIKDRLTRAEWNGMDEDMLHELAYEGTGIRKFIQELVQFAIDNCLRIITLEEAYRMVLKGDIDE